MTASSLARTPDLSPTRNLLDTVRYHLRGWRGIVILGGIAIAAGLAFNWGWLVAAGVAPVLLSFLPCAAMCALGLCMSRMGGRSCSTETSTQSTVREIPSPIPTTSDAKDHAIPVIAAATGKRETEQEKETDRCVVPALPWA